jgi:hypothetical protein
MFDRCSKTCCAAEQKKQGKREERIPRLITADIRGGGDQNAESFA